MRCVLSGPMFHGNRAAEPSVGIARKRISSGKQKCTLLAAGQGNTAILQQDLRWARLRHELTDGPAQIRCGGLNRYPSIEPEWCRCIDAA